MSRSDNLLQVSGYHVYAALRDFGTNAPDSWSSLLTVPIIMMEINQHLVHRGFLKWEVSAVLELQLQAMISQLLQDSPELDTRERGILQGTSHMEHWIQDILTIIDSFDLDHLPLVSAARILKINAASIPSEFTWFEACQYINDIILDKYRVNQLISKEDYERRWLFSKVLAKNLSQLDVPGHQQLLKKPCVTSARILAKLCRDEW